MSKATLKGYMSPEISFFNILPHGTQLKLDTKCSYNVKYSNELTCRGEISIDVSSKDQPDKFYVKVKMIGVFSFDAGADKDLLHLETFQLLFPYVRALVSTITSNAGVPPIVLPHITLEGQNIYRIGNM